MDDPKALHPKHVNWPSTFADTGQSRTQMAWEFRSSPTRRSKDLYYRFHRDHGHNTKDRYVLKEQMELW